jgi:hypothetical protein
LLSFVNTNKNTKPVKKNTNTILNKHPKNGNNNKNPRSYWCGVVVVVVLDLEDVGGERQWQMAESGGGG